MWWLSRAFGSCAAVEAVLMIASLTQWWSDPVRATILAVQCLVFAVIMGFAAASARKEEREDQAGRW